VYPRVDTSRARLLKRGTQFLLRIKIIHQITGTVENSQKYTTDNKINVHEWGNVESRDTGNIGQLRIQRHLDCPMFSVSLDS
jgi:hypothetical protein